MAKNKKNKGADSQEDVARDQKNVEEGASPMNKAPRKGEEYEEEQSLPGKKRNGKQQSDQDHDIYNEDEVKEAAKEGEGSDSMNEKSAGKGSTRQAIQSKKKSQSSSGRNARKSNSKPAARTSSGGRSPMKKKASSPSRAGNKSKAKSR